MFLVPISADRYELYCEAVPDEAAPEAAPSPGVVSRLRRTFSEALEAAERDRTRRETGELEDASTVWGRLKARVLAWIADAIAEQRLLWHLRRQESAQLHFPADTTADRALAISRTMLARDRDRHRFWLCIDSVLLVLSGALFFVPGPNLVGYYFAFRVVGHFLSWRGARQGLDRVQWELVASEPLAELRRAIDLGPHQRERHLVDIALRLRLENLATFVERVAYRGA